jgi:hypothetical protein
MLWEAVGVRCGSGNKSELVGDGRNQSESVGISWNARETDQVSLSWAVAVQKEAGVRSLPGLAVGKQKTGQFTVGDYRAETWHMVSVSN